MKMRLFLSSVTDRAASDSKVRDPLRTWLDDQLKRVSTPCVYQEFLRERGVNTLEKIAMAIEEQCDVVVHILDSHSGCVPDNEFVPNLLRYCNQDEIRNRFPYLFEIDIVHNCEKWKRFSYTHWEAWLAMFLNKKLIIIVLESSETKKQFNAEFVMTNEEHLEFLERDAGRPIICKSSQEVLFAIKDTLLYELQSSSQLTSDRITWPTTSYSPATEIANRNEEVDCFLELVSNHCNQKALLMIGPSNRGKSTLIREFQRILLEMAPIASAIANFKGGVTMAEVLNRLSDDLSKSSIRFTNYRNAVVQSPSTIDAAFITDITLAMRPIVLLLDTYEEASRECKQWVELSLLPFIFRQDSLRVVITGHCIPEPRERWKSTMQILRIEPILDAIHWCRYRDKIGVATPVDNRIREYFHKTNGDPIAMDYFIRNGL